jgi:quercetin dioxygenase-like cupin family protein
MSMAEIQTRLNFTRKTMIKQGDTITNARTGQVMIFRKTAAETNGSLLEIECFNPRTDEREPVHIHPQQESSAEVISGKLHFWIDGKEHIVSQGERIVIPPGVPHCFWNEDQQEAHHIQRFYPALNIACFFETFFALSKDNKLNKNGIPNFLHASIIALAHKNEIRLTKPPWPIQYLTYLLLTPIGKLMGYRADYRSKN